MCNHSVSALNKVVRGSKRATYEKDTVYQILDDTFMCNIGYVWENNAIVIPTAYGRDKDIIYIHGSLKNRMMRGILETGKVCLSITHLDGLVLARSAFHHSANYRSVNVFGSVREVQDADEKMKALECIMNHMVAGHWESVRKPNKKEFDATLVIAVTIDTASAKIRAEGVIDEKSDMNSDYWAGVVPIKQVAGRPESDEKLAEGIVIPDSVLTYVANNR
ncbi:pyridoxamine 5'-phosphate oxidase family protein [Aquimarina sp. TRL1]|uniref:pyridoxamine 5'-phosphate oxidase family protein n=1 Tax=Aquimarina sp. (strain TRL1) TaxID=2736252 RepID=UPI00158B5782|nr:pyridoxamine 5'-phosphate oxidase family protein [Aquimarina sp. TRL1]QKX06495.1 pyridoxamine 5'-phosphate oxidase family protein [Aquimarina sp. TRL1]